MHHLLFKMTFCGKLTKMERVQRRMITGSDPFDKSALDKRLLGEAGEIIERTGDEPLSAWVLSLRGRGEQLEKVSRARYRFSARRGRSSVEKLLQFFLAIP